MLIKRILKIIIVLTFIFSLLSFTGVFRKVDNDKKTEEKISKGFYLVGKDKVIVDYGSKYVDEGFVASVEKNKSIKDVTITNNVDTSQIGEYEVTYSITYKNISKTFKTFKLK